MNSANQGLITRETNKIIGRLCWYANYGELLGHSFLLSIGEKILRPKPLDNRFHSDEYNKYQGQYALLVSSAWRIEDRGLAIGASTQEVEPMFAALDKVVGTVVTEVTLSSPCGDLTLEFANGCKLIIFCERLFESPNDTNWELFTPDYVISANNRACLGIKVAQSLDFGQSGVPH